MGAGASGTGAGAIEWPAWMRRGPNRAGRVTSSVHHERTAAILGVALGISFTVCFLTGLFSHWGQSSEPIIAFPSRPAGLYRITQAAHVFTGVLSIPLLLAKLWTVLPRFFEFPPVRSIAHALERLALFPLVAGSLFLLVSGVNNVAAWYPWEFNFVVAHYWTAWITIGGLVVHVGAKIHLTRQVLAAPSATVEADGTRRSFLGVAGATGLLVGGSVASQSIAPLQPIGFLSPRDLDIGVQGLPVNSSAARRRVVDAATSADYRLRVTGDVDRELSFTLGDLRQLRQHEAVLPIACVEGWSKSAHWRGVRLRDLLVMAGADIGSSCTVFSLQERGGFRSSFVGRHHAWDRDTLLALELNGEVLHLDHGFPARLIAPNRPGVGQTKWVREVRVT